MNMRKLFLTLIVSFSLYGTISGQNRPPGIITKTVPRGTVVPGSMPHADAERHKIRLASVEGDYEVLILFQNFINGNYIPREHFEERVAFVRFGPQSPLVYEIALELQNDSSLCKLFFLFPDMRWIKYKAVSDQSTFCLKFLFFDYDTQITDNASLPLLLVYEDNRTTGEIENKLKAFVTNGKLKKTAKTNEFIERNIENYSLLNYQTTKLQSTSTE